MPLVLNPLDAVCNVPRPDAVCVSNLRNAKKADKAVLSERPDVKIFLPFRFYFYRVEELFTPNTYNKFLGKCGVFFLWYRSPCFWARTEGANEWYHPSKCITRTWLKIEKKQKNL
uniref:Uncharacterized protein n=1 Tax=Anopheles maculatus TaxID=74869 RepID=A0A182SN15_9DIPT